MSKNIGKREKSEKGNSNGLEESVECVKKELNLITKHLFSARWNQSI